MDIAFLSTLLEIGEVLDKSPSKTDATLPTWSDARHFVENVFCKGLGMGTFSRNVIFDEMSRRPHGHSCRAISAALVYQLVMNISWTFAMGSFSSFDTF